MPHIGALQRVLLGAVLGGALLAGCNESDGSLESAASGAERAFEAQGFSAEGAACMVDSLLSDGIAAEDLEDIDSAGADQELLDAAADAGMECASEIADDIPADLIDLEDPVVRQQFVRTFAQTTGLSTEAADCVAQYFIDNDVDYGALVAAAGGAEPDPDTAAQVNVAIETCA